MSAGLRGLWARWFGGASTTEIIVVPDVPAWVVFEIREQANIEMQLREQTTVEMETREATDVTWIVRPL